MKSLLTLLVCAYSTILCAQMEQRYDVYFDNNSFSLSSVESQKLINQIKSLQLNKNYYKVKLFGYTDSDGNIELNNELSQNRSNAVAEFFKANGFDQEQMLIKGYGAKNFVADNSSETGKAKNRRVEIQVYQIQQEITPLLGLSVKEHKHKIDAQVDQEIKTAGGTVINIPANALVDKDGNLIKGHVDISYKEYRDPADFMASDIPMNHGDGFFESAGMFDISASQNGNEVFIKEGQKVDVNFKVNKLDSLDFYYLDRETNTWVSTTKATGQTNPVAKDKLDPTFIPSLTIDEYVKREKMKYDSNLDVAIKYLKARENPKEPVLLYDERYLRSGFAGTVDLSKVTSTLTLDSLKSYTLNATIPNNVKKKPITFVIEDKYNRQPELSPYLGMKFSTNEVAGRIPLDNVFNKGFYDIRVYYRGNGRFHISVKDEIEFMSFYANLDGEYDDEQLSELDSNYRLTLSQQKEAFDAEVVASKAYKDYKNFAALMSTSSEMLQSIAEPFITEKERSKIKYERTWNGRSSWGAYTVSNLRVMKDRLVAVRNQSKDSLVQIAKSNYPEFVKKEKARYESNLAYWKSQRKYNRAMAALSIGSFGVYNADQVKRLPQRIVVDAIYLNESGDTIQGEKLYVKYQDLNSVIYYANGFMGYDANHFAVSNKSESKMVLVGKDDKTYFILSDRMPADFRDKRLHRLIVRELSEDTSLEDLRDMLRS